MKGSVKIFEFAASAHSQQPFFSLFLSPRHRGQTRATCSSSSQSSSSGSLATNEMKEESQVLYDPKGSIRIVSEWSLGGGHFQRLLSWIKTREKAAFWSISFKVDIRAWLTFYFFIVRKSSWQLDWSSLFKNSALLTIKRAKYERQLSLLRFSHPFFQISDSQCIFLKKFSSVRLLC